MKVFEVREARPDDVTAILEIYTPLVRATEVSFEIEPPSSDEIALRMEKSHLWLVAETDGRVSGYAYASPFNPRAAYRWSVEVSVYVHDDHRRSGVGRALLEELLEKLEARGFVNVFAGIALPNDGSVRLFESLGFERIALQKEVGFKLGRWIDVAWWQKQLRDRTTPPPEPSV